MNDLVISKGDTHYLGVSFIKGVADAINIAVLAPSARSIFFCIFDEHNNETARLKLPARTGQLHHGRIDGLKIPERGLWYGLRAEGDFIPEQGVFYDTAKLLVDPYAKELNHSLIYDDALCCRNLGVETKDFVPKAVLRREPINTDLSVIARLPRLIYEASVRSLTMLHPDVPAHLRGTVAALREPCIIEHLLKIGVDTLELMPITAWINERHLDKIGLYNAWGYNPIAMMALEPDLCPNGIDELRETVAALREVGIQVIMDVVFNHTGESDAFGPTLSMRGLDNRYYYLHDDQFNLVNDTGCGNTLACMESGVVQLVMDSLRYWVQAAGIAGFRFDLAPVLGRLKSGFDRDAPLLAAMRQDPVLNKVLLIAEPWDIGFGGYQFGHFGAPWMEWNDHYRDDVRRFWQGNGSVASLATRLAGSSDVFASSFRWSTTSVNFIAAHDGFCMRDLVSYNEKHNWANGEDNRDGSNDNISWNNGTEGETHDERIIEARKRDVRALLATLFLSQGTAMLTAGDELGRTKHGNNNSYAQNNTSAWIDWVNKDQALIDYVAELSALRLEFPLLRQEDFLTPKNVNWYRADGGVMTDHDWHNHTQILGMRLHGDQCDLLVWLNAGQNDVSVSLPEDVAWHHVLSSTESESINQVARRSVVILKSDA